MINLEESDYTAVRTALLIRIKLVRESDHYQSEVVREEKIEQLKRIYREMGRLRGDIG
jgi:hypothetical protein